MSGLECRATPGSRLLPMLPLGLAPLSIADAPSTAPGKRPASATGAHAVGATALGAVAVRSLDIGELRVGKLHVDELTVASRAPE